MARWRARLLLLFACLAATAVYAPSLRNTFAMDDRFVAKAAFDDGRPNPLVAELQPIARYFGSHYWAGSSTADELYRPVTILSYALVYALAGRPRDEAGEALPQHLLNLALHGLAVLLTYRLLRLVRAGRVASGLGSLVFGLHAVHSEVVAAVVGRAELLAFTLGAAAALLALGRRRAWLRWPLASGCFFLAFAAKEGALGWLPFAVVLAAARGLARDRERGLGRAALVALPRLLAIAAPPLLAFFWLRARMLAGLPEPPVVSALTNPLAHAALEVRLLTATMLQGKALWLMLWPGDLVCDYSDAAIRMVSVPIDPRFLGALVALAALVGAGARFAVGAPLLLPAGLALPVLGFVASNLPFATGTIFAERLLYAPSLAAAFAIAWAAGWVPRRRRAAVLAGTLLLAWLAVHAATIVRRNPVWRDDAALFLHDVEVQPRSARLQYCAAKQHEKRGERLRMLERLERAVDLHPDYALAWSDLGATAYAQGDLFRAQQCLRRGLASLTRDAEATFLLARNLAGVLAEAGQRDESERLLRKALHVDPVRFRGELEAILAHMTRFLPTGVLVQLLAEGERMEGDPLWALHRAGLALHAGDPEYALAELRQALTLGAAGTRPLEVRAVAQRLAQDSLAPAAARAEAARVLESLTAQNGR